MLQPSNGQINRSACLSVLSRAPAAEVKQLADALVPALEPIQVFTNRIGLVMLPMSEPVKGTMFYLGELLIAEARVRAGGVEGYAACLGRDLEQALALALIDAANAAGLAQAEIAHFLQTQAARLQNADEQLLRWVEATRVEMETFEWLMPK